MSIRENKRISHDIFEKKLRALMEERNSLRKIKWSLGYELLDKPIFDGYSKILTLRYDLLNNKNTNYLLGLLDIVYNSRYYRDKAFLRYNSRTKKQEEIKVGPKSIHQKEYDDLPMEYKKEFFKEVKSYTFYGSFSISKTVYTVENQWRFTTKVIKHFKTKVKIIDSDIERRLDEINHFIEANNLYSKIDRLSGCSYKDSWGIEDERKARLKRERFVDEEMYEEKLNYLLGGN